MATSVQPAMDENEDSDMDERNTKGVTVHRSSFAGAWMTTTPNTTTATTTTTTATWSKSTSSRNTPSLSLKSCASGFCECCECFWGTLFNFLSMIWTKYNKINMAIFFLIGLGVTLGLLIFFSDRYHNRLTNPSSFHYTTCIITGIAHEKDDDDDWWNTITFIYGRDGNSDWSQSGKYKLKQKDWDENNNEGSIGTCVYSEDGNNWGESFTLQNYLIHTSTSAMWLILDNKFGLISYIIFFAFSLLFCIIASVGWLILKCDFVGFAKASLGGFGLFVVACMIVGWPVMIMSSVIMAGLNGPLGDGIAVTDVYEDMGDCIIRGYEFNVTYIAEREDAVPFTMVGYNVFTTDGDLIAVDIYKNTTQAIYFGIDDVENCYTNRYSQQMVINEYPNVEWLQFPMKRRTAIIAIVVGILLICAPCTIAVACNNN